MAVGSTLEGEVRIQLSMGRREQAIALLGSEGSPGSFLRTPTLPLDVRLGAFEEALTAGRPGQALIGARALLNSSPVLPFLWWMAKSLETRALLDLEYYDEALQSIDPMTLKSRRNQFWWYDTLLTLAWVHVFRGESREVRRTVVPQLLLCRLPGFGPWFQGQGNFLLGLTASSPAARQAHFAQAAEAFGALSQLAVYSSSWKAENLYFGAIAAYEASGRVDVSPLARAKLLLASADWSASTFDPVREALQYQLRLAHGETELERPNISPRRYFSNLERYPEVGGPLRSG